MPITQETWCFKGGKCVKQVTYKGKLGERPKENATCQVFVKVKAMRDLLCPESEYLRHAFNGTVVVGNADCEVDNQIEMCVRSMVPEEECDLKLTFEESPGEVILIIILKSFVQFPDVFKWSRKEKLEIAKQHKQKGVQLFQAGRLRDSFIRFNKAVRLMITLGIEDDTEAKLLYVQACNNMALCHLKQGSINHALTLCNKVLNADPSNVKALLRRSDAYTKLKDIELAVLDLRMAKQLEPNNGVARERLIVLQHRLELENIKYANMIKRMFQ